MIPAVAGRDGGQRWLDWVNEDPGGDTCPAFGVISLVASQFDGRSLIFTGRRQSPSYAPTEELRGADWYVAFNGPRPVEAGQRGKLTFDLPAWCQITPGIRVGRFMSVTTDPTDWRLHTVPFDEPDQYLWGGFNVFAKREIKDDNGNGIYTIGFVGGLVTYLHGTKEEVIS